MDPVHSTLDQSPLPFLHLTETLKHLPRTGWLRTINKPESVASHMYRVALLAMFAPDNLNKEKCIFLALCHDIAESVVGDIPTYAGVAKEQKYKLEDVGFRYVQSLLDPINPSLGAEIRNAWLEYERGRTPEARYVREMDKFECMVQAFEYEQRTHGEKDLGEFQGLSSKITSPEGKSWLELLQQERQAHFLKRKRRIPVIFFIGAPGCGKKTQCELLCQTSGFQKVSVVDVLHERSNDHTYLHANFVKHCLEEQVDVPRDLAIDLLERKINEGVKEGKKWSLVCGFPESVEELLQFEEKVQKANYTLLLNCSTEEVIQRVARLGNERDDELEVTKRVKDFQTQNADVENHLKDAEAYFKTIDGCGSIQEVHGKVVEAVNKIIQHAEGERKA